MDKEHYKQQAKKKLNQVFMMIDKIEGEKDKVKGEVKLEFEEKLSELKLQKIYLQIKYEELVDNTEGKWKDVKMTFLLASESFKDGCEKIRSLM